MIRKQTRLIIAPLNYHLVVAISISSHRTSPTYDKTNLLDHHAIYGLPRILPRVAVRCWGISETLDVDTSYALIVFLQRDPRLKNPQHSRHVANQRPIRASPEHNFSDGSIKLIPFHNLLSCKACIFFFFFCWC